MEETGVETMISRVGPWKNKDEFNLVYDRIFGENSDNHSKQLAFDQMIVWKIRRLNLTPATILSTISILEVQLKDTNEKRFSTDELRSMYSNAFTRFLNYMSSIMRNRHLQSMYLTARELGIESFLVDLRHLCAHGQILPSLEISRRTANYCLNWLRDFYWDRERNFIIDATVRDVHLKSSIEMETEVRYWFSIYDASTEGSFRGCKIIDDLKLDKQNDRMDDVTITLMENCAEQIRNSRLNFIATKAINELTRMSQKTERDRGNAYIYCDAFLNCTHLIGRSSMICRNESKTDRNKFVGFHQNLFRLFAICDYVNVIFMRLISICEDELEDKSMRSAASFWANEIATGFLVFKQFKNYYKMKKEKNAKFEVNMAPINTDIMTDDIKQIYKELGVNFRGTLIFGDTVRRPWSLHFDRDFLMERATCINYYTIDVIKKCIRLIEPSLSQSEAEYIERLITIYMDLNPKDSHHDDSTPDDNSFIVHTIDECFVNDKPIETEKQLVNNSIWRDAPDGLNWKTCPLGSLPWNNTELNSIN